MKSYSTCTGYPEAKCNKQISSESKEGLGKISLNDGFIIYRHGHL